MSAPRPPCPAHRGAPLALLEVLGPAMAKGCRPLVAAFVFAGLSATAFAPTPSTPALASLWGGPASGALFALASAWNLMRFSVRWATIAIEQGTMACAAANHATDGCDDPIAPPKTANN